MVLQHAWLVRSCISQNGFCDLENSSWRMQTAVLLYFIINLSITGKRVSWLRLPLRWADHQYNQPSSSSLWSCVRGLRGAEVAATFSAVHPELGEWLGLRSAYLGLYWFRSGRTQRSYL